MEELSAVKGNRSVVMALSLRYGMPSKYTSWLAVPKAEMERYEREIAEAKIGVVAHRLAKEISLNRENGPKARHLRAQLNRLCKKAGQDPKETLREQLYEAVQEVVSRLAVEISKGRENSKAARQLQTRLNRLCRETGDSPQRALRDQLSDAVGRLAYRIVQKSSQEDRPTQTTRQLRARLNRLCRHTGDKPETILRGYLQQEVGAWANELAGEVIGHRESSPNAKSSRTKLERACRKYGLNFQNMLASSYVYERELRTLAYELITEQHGGKHISMQISQEENGETAVVNGYSEKPNPARIPTLQTELNRLARAVGRSADQYIQEAERPWILLDVQETRKQLLAERRKAKPDSKVIEQLEQKFIALNAKVKTPQYAQMRTRRLAVKTDLERLDQEITAAQRPANAQQLATLKQQKAVLQQREGELRARMGDPLLRIEAPADAQQVIALLPNGEIKRLAFNRDNKRWEARFDIPTYATEGEYVITVIIVLKDGTRKTLTLHYHVDLTPPTGAGRAQIASDAHPVLRLELDADEDTARVKALLPWGEQVALKPSGQAHRFFALVPVTPAQRNAASVVTFILTDKAHNRTVIQVDMTR